MSVGLRLLHSIYAVKSYSEQTICNHNNNNNNSNISNNSFT